MASSPARGRPGIWGLAVVSSFYARPLPSVGSSSAGQIEGRLRPLRSAVAEDFAEPRHIDGREALLHPIIRLLDERGKPPAAFGRSYLEDTVEASHQIGRGDRQAGSDNVEPFEAEVVDPVHAQQHAQQLLLDLAEHAVEDWQVPALDKHFDAP